LIQKRNIKKNRSGCDLKLECFLESGKKLASGGDKEGVRQGKGRVAEKPAFGELRLPLHMAEVRCPPRLNLDRLQLEKRTRKL